TDASPRLIPSGTDVWAKWSDHGALITAVRYGSNAAAAGLCAGMKVVAVGGKPMQELVRARLPQALDKSDPAAYDWATRAVLAGFHNQPVRLRVRLADGSEKQYHYTPGLTQARDALLTSKVLDHNIGYIRINNSLGDDDLIAAWDSALARLQDTKALILDLRSTPSGGNTHVGRGLMGRLVDTVQKGELYELPQNDKRYGVRKAWIELVSPRGPFAYTKPVVVLVGRWTGSMGEGIAMVLDEMKRATLIGSKMARLHGATQTFTLPNSKIPIEVPYLRLYGADGTPREDYVPDIAVKSGQCAAKNDAVLDAAQKLLHNDVDHAEVAPTSPRSVRRFIAGLSAAK
ncbi:MAG: S41 family peptidase, partial [Xanthomonadales bacterium]|nr:S41 family peptidase [Xanthomonadales bacterium]